MDGDRALSEQHQRIVSASREACERARTLVADARVSTDAATDLLQRIARERRIRAARGAIALWPLSS